MFDLLLGKRSATAGQARSSRTGGANSTQFGPSQMTQGSNAVHAVRKDLLRVAMRDTLTRNGIPPSWLSAEMLRTNSSKREPGMHVRLVMQHWDPRLMLHGVALERDFLQRLLALDPQAQSWLTGFSWQFGMDDTSKCPPLPHPGLWTAPPPAAQPAVPAEPAAATQSGDVIEGPTVIPRPMEDVRADLERMLARRDDDMRRQGGNTDHFAPTRPATLS